MKLSKLLLITSALFLVAGCTLNTGGDDPEPTPEPTPTPTPTPTPEPIPPAHIDQSFDFTILSTNDIHGQIDPEDPTANGGRAGLVKYLSYAKWVKENEDNVFLFDQGDTFQGNIYSNHNRGALITDAMNYVQYNAKCVGNHDFDWGLQPLRHNKTLSYDGYTTPVLGANVYDYDFASKTVGNNLQTDLADNSVTYTLANGFKVGIIGTIGQSQITSINTLYVKDIIFKNHVTTIKEEATKLKNEGCHFIVSLHHGDVDELYGKGLSSYIDLGLCAHTHSVQEQTEGNTKYFQFWEYTKMLGKLSYHFNKNTQKVEYVDNESLYSAQIWNSGIDDDPVISSLVNTYKQQTDQEVDGQQIVANNVSGFFDDYNQGANLVAKAVYKTALKEGYDVDFAYVNQLRHDLYSGEWTYGDIYQAAPFDNVVYIYDITYSEMINEIKRYNFICKEPGREIEYKPGDTFKVACLDYLLFHTNSSRHFDYFPSLETNFVNYQSFPTLSKTYREILKDYLISEGYNTGKSLSSYDFESSVSEFNKDEMHGPTYTVTLHWNDGRGEDDVFKTIKIPVENPILTTERVGGEPELTDYFFSYWSDSRDVEGETIYWYGSTISGSMDLYAHYYQKSHDRYTLTITSGYFDVGDTVRDFLAYNDYRESLQVHVTCDPVPDLGPDYPYLFGMAALGNMHFSVSTDYFITHIDVTQHRYMNLELYGGDPSDPTNKLDATYEDYNEYKSVWINPYENNLSDIYIHNTYSGAIRLDRISIDFRTKP